MQTFSRNVWRVMMGLAGLAVLLGLAVPSCAQVILLPPPPTGGYIDPPGHYAWQNPSARAALGADQSVSGSWFFGTTTGNPFSTDDDYLRLIAATEAYLYIAEAGKEFKVAANTGRFLSLPALNPNLETAGFRWTTNDDEFPLEVTFSMRLVRDVLKWEYRLKNTSAFRRRIGFRLLENVMFPLNEPLPTATGSGTTQLNLMLESPYYFPQGQSTTVTAEYLDSAIPNEWAVRFPETPSVDLGYRSYWKGRQSLRDAVTRPSRLVFANWIELPKYTWDKILEEQLPENANQPPTLKISEVLGFNSGVGLYYPILSLAPNQTRIITGEVQFNWAQVNTIGHYALAGYAPDWIGYREGDDLSTPTVENGFYAPNFADINAWICNSSLIDDPNVSVTISPGEGLELAPGQVLSYNNKILKGLQDELVKRTANDSYSWRLVPNGKAFGLIPVRITATYSLAGSISSVVYVNVPALPKRALQPATYLMGFPFLLDTDASDGVNTANARVALGLGPNVQLAWYDPAINTYRYAAVDDITLEPGRGYWLRLTNPTTLSLVSATPVDQRQRYLVTLSKGWNAISTPFQFGVEWGKCRIMYAGTEYSFNEAVQLGMIRSEIWAWDPISNVYNPPSNPFPQNAVTTELKPYQGYWLYATRPLSLAYMPEPTLAVMNPNLPGARSRAAGTADQWQANLVVQAGEAKDIVNTFGVQSTNGTADGNMMEPPISPAGLSAYFPLRDGTRAAGNYAVSLLAPGGPKSWSFEVQCTRANTEVNLRWPDLTNLPAGLPVVLVDELTGTQVSLRTSSGYSYNSGQGGLRRFTLQAGGPQERLRFTQVQVAAGRRTDGAAVSYTLSLPATVTARWRTPTGRLVRTLTPGRSSGELTAVSWDGRDTQGRRLPAGIYLCELLAETADGQRTRSTITVPVK
jgi:hypothetical protein